MEGLLDRTNMSTKVVRNTEIKQVKKEAKSAKNREVETLRQKLKSALTKKGITDLVGVFKRFDTNGDGYFNMIEFGCAFTVLKVDFSQEDLRKLIRLTDTNNDGRISYQEFEKMINATDIQEIAEEADEILESSEDESSSKPT